MEVNINLISLLTWEEDWQCYNWYWYVNSSYVNFTYKECLYGTLIHCQLSIEIVLLLDVYSYSSTHKSLFNFGGKQFKKKNYWELPSIPLYNSKRFKKLFCTDIHKGHLRVVLYCIILNVFKRTSDFPHIHGDMVTSALERIWWYQHSNIFTTTGGWYQQISHDWRTFQWCKVCKFRVLPLFGRFSIWM